MKIWVNWYFADTDFDIWILGESPYIDFHPIAYHPQRYNKNFIDEKKYSKYKKKIW